MDAESDMDTTGAAGAARLGHLTTHPPDPTEGP